jgi:putative membrane protein
MTTWYENGMMSSGGGLFAGILTLIVWGLAVVGAIALIRGWRSGGFNLDRRSPEQILDERFARGEIDIEEYTRRRQLLRPGH